MIKFAWIQMPRLLVLNVSFSVWHSSLLDLATIADQIKLGGEEHRCR